MWLRPAKRLAALPSSYGVAGSAGWCRSTPSKPRTSGGRGTAWPVRHQLRGETVLQPTATPPKQPRPNRPPAPAATTAAAPALPPPPPSKPQRSNHSALAARLDLAHLWPLSRWHFNTWAALGCSRFASALNNQGQQLFLAVNCSAKNDNTTGRGRASGRPGPQPQPTLKNALIVDACR